MNDTALPGKPGTNRHPVDQLGQIRLTIKTLQDREAGLKEEVGQMMGKADSLGGDEYIAFQKLQSRKGSLDEKAMLAAGIDIERYRKSGSTYIVLTTVTREQEDA